MISDARKEGKSELKITSESILSTIFHEVSKLPHLIFHNILRVLVSPMLRD